MLKANNRRRLNISDGATAGSKLDMDLNIGGPAKPVAKSSGDPPASTSSPKTPPPASSASSPSPPAAPPSVPPVSLASPKPAGASIVGSDDSKKPGPSPKPTDQTNLNSLKHQALTKLSPLVEDLEQPPLEHFRTLMMLIQATDDSSLINRALETANSISDDKERAQALLDIVNEINYFTSQTNKNKPAPN